MRRYATSKLCNALHVTALAEQHPGLRVVAFDPGLVPGTGLARGASPAARLLWERLAPLLRRLPGANAPDVPGRELAALADGSARPLSGAYVQAGSGGDVPRPTSPGTPRSLAHSWRAAATCSATCWPVRAGETA